MDKKNVTIVVLLLFLVAVVSGGAVYLWQQSSNNNEATSESVAAQDASEEAEPKDTEISKQSEQQVQISDEEAITKAMATRHNRPVNEVDLTVNKNTGNHASGLVKFDGDISGGWWLAAKDNGEWVVVADGNGTVLCDDIDSYNFPTDMVPECWDETTQTLITR